MGKLHNLAVSDNKIYKIESYLVREILTKYTCIRINRESLYGINKSIRREQSIIVSLTSYQARFETIIPTLKSLLVQTVRPDRIVVWLNCSSGELTAPMLELKRYGIEYRCNCNVDNNINLRSHKKYFWAFQEYSNDIVITVDDDCIYPPTLISSLMRAHKRYPNCVCARRVHKMSLENDFPSDYCTWKMEYSKDDGPSNFLMATGVGGVLYVPKQFISTTFDVDDIETLCLSADDIWLKYMEVLSGIKVAWARNYMPHPIETVEAQATALRNINITENRNNVCISNLMSKYGHEFIKKIYL